MRSRVFVAALAAVALLVAGCGEEDTDGPAASTTVAPNETTAAPDATTAPTTAAADTTTTAPDGTVDLRAYFLRGEQLAITHRAVPETPAVLRAALEQLLQGPTGEEAAAGLTTEVPEGTQLLDVALADGTAVVDLSGSFDDGGGSLSMRARVAQVVFTATQFDNVDAVAFRLDGEAVTEIGGEGVVVDPPLQRVDVEDIAGPILVDQPQPDTTVTSPLTVTGESDTYEAVLELELVDAGGQVLASEVVMATSGTGTWGTFEATLTFEAEPGPLTLRAIESTGADPSEGPPPRVVEVPLTAG